MHYRMNYASASDGAEYSNQDGHLPHSCEMEPRKLLLALMHKAGDNSNSLAVKLKFAVKQPQIYKFMHGLVNEPKRSNIEPIAAHYGVPVEAFYDPQVAEEEFEKVVGVVKDAPSANVLAWRGANKPQEQEDDEAGMVMSDPRTRSMVSEAMVEDLLYQALPKAWDVRKEYGPWADLTAVDGGGKPAFAIEIKLMRLRGRWVDKYLLDATIGRLWQASRHTQIPIALVLVLHNEDDQFEVNSDLFRSMDDAVDGKLIACYTVLSLKSHGSNFHFGDVQTAYPRKNPENIAALVKLLALN